MKNLVWRSSNIRTFRLYIVTYLGTGFELVIGFIGFLKLVTTINYSATVNSRTLQFTTAHPLCLHRLSPCDTPNAADSSASVFHGSGPRWMAHIS
jgi:hypothetical protein